LVLAARARLTRLVLERKQLLELGM
jgi:hypothetical protein